MPPKSTKPKSTQKPADHCYWEALKQGKPLVWDDDLVPTSISTHFITDEVDSVQTSTDMANDTTNKKQKTNTLPGDSNAQQFIRLGSPPQQTTPTNNPKNLRFLLFYGHHPSSTGEITNSCLSQWWATSFTLNGITYPNCETWMMAEKARLFSSGLFEEFADKNAAILKQILATKDPAKAKKLGRQVLGFDQTVWEQYRFDTIVKGNWLKFTQNQDLMDYLLETKNHFDVMVEASPRDRTYGIGLGKSNPSAHDPNTWRGANLLGFALTRVRDALIEMVERSKNISEDTELDDGVQNDDDDDNINTPKKDNTVEDKNQSESDMVPSDEKI